MGIIGGLDVHRSQVTYDWVDHDTGEFGRGKARPATRQALRQWLNALPSSEGALAVEATTGWRFVVEEITRAGFRAHLAEPADTSAARGKKKRAKTDSADAEHQRRLLEQARLPESWIPPGHILDLRTTVRPQEDADGYPHRVAAAHPCRAVSPRAAQTGGSVDQQRQPGVAG